MKEIMNRVVEVIGTPMVCLLTKLILKRVDRKIRRVKDGKDPMSELVGITVMLESEYLLDLKKYWYTCRLQWANKACLHYILEIHKAIFKINYLFHNYNMTDL